MRGTSVWRTILGYGSGRRASAPQGEILTLSGSVWTEVNVAFAVYLDNEMLKRAGTSYDPTVEEWMRLWGAWRYKAMDGFQN